MTSNPFKVSGPEVTYEVAGVKCCRVWPVITATLTWTEGIDGWKRETWWWRNCVYCGEYPRPVDERGIEGDPKNGL